MEKADSDVWKTPRLSNRTFISRKLESGMKVMSDGRGVVPAAVVQPCPPRDQSGNVLESGRLGPDLTTQHQHNFTQVLSPQLLSVQVFPNSSHTPVSGYEMIPCTSLRPDDYSPTTQEGELRTLRSQVQQIQDRLTDNVLNSKEYQKLATEKNMLDHILCAVENELERQKEYYRELEKNSSAKEKTLVKKLHEMEESKRMLEDQNSLVSDELKKLKNYLRVIPTPDEHLKLQQEFARMSSHKAHLSKKVDNLSEQMALLTKRDNENEVTIGTLRLEKDDLAIKLNLTENILKDLENQREAAEQEGMHSKEELLWRLEQLRKEHESAKKLLNYRKQKIECLQKERLSQDEKHREKLQKELENNDTLKDCLYEKEKLINEYKEKEEKLKTSIEATEEKLKKAEERLELSTMQVESHHQMSTTISTLVSHVDHAVCQLQDLVTISQQMSLGETPDLSILLNFSGTVNPETSFTLGDLKARLVKVRKLIQQLEGIRTALQEQHANHLAHQMSCAQM